MKREAAVPAERSREGSLETWLSNPPEDRKLDRLWADGASGPAQRGIAWRVACRGGTVSALAGETPGLVAQLNGARENLEIATARFMKPEAAELAHLISDLEERIAQRTAIVEAAGGRIEVVNGKTMVRGGWLASDQRALDHAVGLAQFALTEATGKVAPYRATWPPIPDFEKRFAPELKLEAAADAALRAARKAADDNLAVLGADRAALMALKARRAA